jgi:predicted aldo/keto reductase-like oxidoreductase
MPIRPLNDTDPNNLVTSEAPLDRAKEIFELQLKRCQVDYIDFYFLHSLRSAEQYKEVFADQKIMDYLLTEKEKGRIKRLGFSYHGANADFPLICDQYKWDFCMIQINYYD